VKRFTFPLETARAWRHRQLELEEGRLQRLFAERESILTAIRDLDDEVRKEEALLSAGILDGEQLASLDRFRHYVAAEKERLHGAVRACDQRIEEQRRRVTEARRHWELLDRLRGKALAQWNAADAREREQLAAELYLARCVRER